ncbi:MAG: hypothetical protein Q8P84_07950 [Deltaproteobacteria bacterium]|nr:hypothetical protein [Deltaproteobacteria bacterium]
MISGGQEAPRIYNKPYFCNNPRSTDVAEKTKCGTQYDQFHQGLSEENTQALNKIVSDSCYIDNPSTTLNPAKCAGDYFEHPETLNAGVTAPNPEGVTARLPSLQNYPNLQVMHGALLGFGNNNGAENNNAADSGRSASTVGTDSYHTIDGNRINEPFVPVEEGEEKSGLSGSLSATIEPIPSGDTFGLIAEGQISYSALSTPNNSISANLMASIFVWPNLAPSYTGNTALQKAWIPTEGKEGKWTDMGAYLSWQTPIDGGNLEVAVPKINLLKMNDKSAEVVSKIQTRLDDSKAMEDGKQGSAAEIFLNSVLAHNFARSSNYGNFKTIWNTVVNEYYPAFEDWMASPSVPASDKASLFSRMFADDPPAVIQTLALWSGKTHKETVEALTVKDPSLFTMDGEGKIKTDEAWFTKLLTAAASLNWSRVYKLPEGYQASPTPAQIVLQYDLELREGYEIKLKDKEAIFVEKLFNAKSNDTEKFKQAVEQLKRDCEQAQIAYPFDVSTPDKNPGNPWAVQKRLNDFVTKIVNGKYQKPAQWLFGLDAGIVDRKHSYAGLGLKPQLIWRPAGKKDFEISGWLFVGAAKSAIIDSEPTVAADGAAVASGFSVKKDVEISKNGTARKASANGGLSYTSAGTNAPEGTPRFVNVNAGVSLTLAPGISNWTATPSFDWKLRHNTINGANRNFLTPALKMMLGKHIFLENKLTFFIGTQGGGDHLDVIGREGTPIEIIDTNKPTLDPLHATVGQNGRIYTGVLGYEWKEGDFVGLGFSALHFSDYLKINDGDNVGDGNLGRNSVFFLVGKTF